MCVENQHVKFPIRFAILYCPNNVFQIGLIPNDCITQNVFSCSRRFATLFPPSLGSQDTWSPLRAVNRGWNTSATRKLCIAFETEPVKLQYSILLSFFVSLMLSFLTDPLSSLVLSWLGNQLLSRLLAQNRKYFSLSRKDKTMLFSTMYYGHSQ